MNRKIVWLLTFLFVAALSRAAIINISTVGTQTDRWAKTMATFEQQDREMPPSVWVSGDGWAKTMAAFEQQDREMPPSPGSVVFVGSSTIKQWNLAQYFPNVPAVNRGLGGSEILDLVNYVDLLVIRHKPRTVVFYAGDQDLAAGKTPEQVADDIRAFVAKVHAALPATRIAFIGVKPSIRRWKLIAKVRKANALIRKYCGNDDRLAYIDVDGPMLGWDKTPRKDLFVKDGLHLTPKGYKLWTVLVRPFLE
jgi:lysophospholipase L1-like esterase